MSGTAPVGTALLALMLLGCEDAPPPELESIEETDELVVITRNAPTTYYMDRHDRPTGFEHDLAEHFAAYLGVELRFELRHSIADVQRALRNGEGHLAAAGLTRLETREQERIGLDWESDSSLSTEMILRKVWQREVDCTVADSNIVAINRRYYPELEMVMPMSEPQELAWIIPKESQELCEEAGERYDMTGSYWPLRVIKNPTGTRKSAFPPACAAS